MDPRLKKNRQTLLLQKRTVISDHELYEMMRSRHVYYVQTELSKQLNRTLKALKQAEKMKLVGFRIQKTMFLKRMAVLEKRRRYVSNAPNEIDKNAPVGNDNKIYHHDRLECEISSISEINANKQACTDLVFINEDNPISNLPQYNNHTSVSTKQSDHGKLCGFQKRTENSPQPKRSRKKKDNYRTSINSGWMCNIQEELQKANEKETENASHLRDDNKGECNDNGMYEETSRPISKLECVQRASAVDENCRRLNEQTDIHNGVKGTVKICSNSHRMKTKEISSSILTPSHFSKFHSKLQSDRASTENIKAGENEKSHKKGCDDLSVVADDLRNLHLSHDNKNINILVEMSDSHHTVAASRIATKSDNTVDQTTLVHALPQLNGHIIKSLSKNNNPCQKQQNTNKVDPVINETAKSTQPILTETNNSSDHKLPTWSRHGDITNSPTRQKPSLPYQITPYLERSRSLLSKKEGILPKTKECLTPNQITGKLERTVTMIFIEDPDDSLERPKSQFDFQAWLSYNKRKRGYTKIFDDNFSTLTTEDTINETDTEIKTLENKRGPRNSVRFHFSRTPKLQTYQKPLTFREKSKEWYLNFLQAKRNQRNLVVRTNSQRYGKSPTRVNNRYSYTLLPEIGSKPGSYLTSGSSSEANTDSKLSISTSSNILLKEATDQRLKRLKDHSKILQVKVRNFVCS